MANVAHASLTGANLHEPKGADTAVSGKVYVANGAGSGVWTYPAGSAYGEIYIAGGATSQTLSAASAYAKLDPGTAWDNNGYNNVTLAADDGQMTMLVAGTYQVSFWASFTTAAISSGAKYYFKYALNGTVGARLVGVQKNTAGADVLNVSATGIVTVAANDILSMHVAGDGTSSSTAITINEAGLSATLLKAS
jgi:hypothetical protein